MARKNNYKAINSWSKGMNKDIDISLLPKESYLHAENFRLVVDNDSSTMALEVPTGNTGYLFQQPGQQWGYIPAGAYILSHCVIRDILVLFVIYNGYSYIYKATITNGTLGTLLPVYNDSINQEGAGARLNFSRDYPIKAIGRYESDNVIKVYWTDGYNKLRFINIMDPTNQSRPATVFDILPIADISGIYVDSIGAGYLDTGMVQYAYQLYNLYGAETSFSSPSNMIGLSSSPIAGNDNLFKGDNEGKNSGKSVSFHISPIDLNFNRIRIVRIHHSSLVDLPKINIIAELSTSSTVSFVDTGTINMGELSVEEFNFANYDFVCNEIETKNNILFAAGITENIWDVDYDARAYRYNQYGNTSIYDENLENPISFTYSQLINNQVIIPETFACRDPYNRPYAGPWEVYQGNGTTLGGEGINVKYSFYTDFEIIDNSPSTPVVETTGSINRKASDGVYKSDRLSFHRDEIYSLAVVFYNDKGQRSYPKWIADIRTPKASTLHLTVRKGKFANLLRIQVEFKTLPVGTVGYQIVRCERTTEDRTILAQGLVGATRVYNSFNCAYPTLSTVVDYQNPSSTNRRLIEFISPEVSFNKNLKHTGGDFLDFVGVVVRDKKFVKTETDSNPFVNLQDFAYNTKIAFVINKLNETSHSYSVSPTTITDVQIASPVTSFPTTEEVLPESIVVGSYTYENFIRGLGANTAMGNHGTVAIMQIDTDLNLSAIPFYNRNFAIYNYKTSKYPYGGSSYTARQQRTYIPCSVVQTVSTLVPNIVNCYGDTYISKFEYLRASVANTANTDLNEWFAEVFIFPVETSIDTRWRSGSTFTQEVTNAGGAMLNLNAVLKQEKAGVYSKNSGARTYTQKEDLYSYNSVYSKSNNITKFIPKPIDINRNKKFDCRVIASDVKINGESSDSWTKFRLNEFIDVDSTYGPIKNLYNYNNNLLFWQPKAFGTLSVNQRSVLQDNNPGVLTLGIGGILDRYDYISNNVGNISQFGVIQGSSGLYWYDTLNSTFYRYNNEGVSPISKIKGLQSFFNRDLDKETKCVGVYDPKYSECIFTLKTGIGQRVTIAFNEIVDSFTSFYSFTTDWYIKTFDGSYYTLNSTRNYPYLHNFGYRSRYYDVVYPSTIKFVVNDNYSETKVFDSLEYKSRSYEENSTGTSLYGNGNLFNETNKIVNVFNDTFNSLKVYTEKQYSGEVFLNTSNTTKREGNFSVVIPRNIVNSDIKTTLNILHYTNHNNTRLFKERIRDKYCIVELKYNNTNYYRFNVPYIITNYRISDR